MGTPDIIIHGAKQHNLKNITVRIPRDRLVVVTGLSGSGKSSLAFDTLYAEGQRRYVESLSAYARQFLERLTKPEVDQIEGLSPTIAIEQRTGSGNPRSTVATTTEIHDYLRLLYAHIGIPHCPACDIPVSGQNAETIAEQLLALPADRRFILLAPCAVEEKGPLTDLLERLQRDGFVRARIDGEIVALEEAPTLARTKRHTVEAVVDRLVSGSCSAGRLTDSVELALRVGGGTTRVLVEEGSGWREIVVSEHLSCDRCGHVLGELLPRSFSFNSPYGACPTCRGLGIQQVFLPAGVVPDPTLSIKDGAIPLWRRGPRRLIIHYSRWLRALASALDFDLTTPWQELAEETRQIILHGSGGLVVAFSYRRSGKVCRVSKPFEGVIPNLNRRFMETESESVREVLRKSMGSRLCPECLGARLAPESRAVRVGGLPLHAFCALSVEASLAFLAGLELSREEAAIAGELLKEIRARLGFLLAVGLGYLTLDRRRGTLSGGEAQRIRLATQIGSGLVGVIYVLDEPSIGLHQRDNDRLLQTLMQLRDAGNTVIVVEHDLATIAKADYVVDLGPGAGRHGGELVAFGPPADIQRCAASLTGQYLAGTRRIAVPMQRSPGSGLTIRIEGAREHNLRNITVDIPLGTLCCVTGVSGSGKSTLVDDILGRGLKQHLGLLSEPPGGHDRILGLEHIDKFIAIDQSPIGRTPRSNPATYTDAFTVMRQLYARLPEARVRGYRPGRFSFNVKGGRCEACKGDGSKKIEMSFLPDVYVQCEACKGKRYNRETLGILFRGRSIADALDMTVDQALDFFRAVPRLARKLETLATVGLGYIHLGQAATTLSGGEAQRVKLAAELARKPKGHTLYVMDEPTTGLHVDDIGQLISVLLKLRDQGTTVLVIEHNLDVIKVADYIIDLGPDGGDGGGEVVATGPPEAVAACARSHTGRYLGQCLPGST